MSLLKGVDKSKLAIKWTSTQAYLEHLGAVNESMFGKLAVCRLCVEGFVARTARACELQLCSRTRGTCDRCESGRSLVSDRHEVKWLARKLYVGLGFAISLPRADSSSSEFSCVVLVVGRMDGTLTREMACCMVIVLFLDMPAWSLGDRRTGVEVVIAGACGSAVASEMVIVFFG